MAKVSRKQSSLNARAKEEQAQIPESILKQHIPRVLDLETFLQARKLELDHFLTILSEKAPLGGKVGNKKSFQLLPKHMRRRAMSHNAYRVPIRNRVLSQCSATLKNPCRKLRRHVKSLIKQYMHRSEKGKWMENHIWHAKRMKMHNLWGYKIPLSLNDKGIRACYRYARSASLIHDSSYYSAFKVYDKSFVKNALNGDFTYNLRTKSLLVYKNKLICPADTFETSEAIVLIIHPAACCEIKNILQENDLKYEHAEDVLTFYRIRGPKSTQLISSVLNIKEQEIRQLLMSAGAFYNFKFPDGAVLTANIHRKLQRPKGFKPMNKYEKTNIVPEQPNYELLKYSMNWPEGFYKSIFWDDIMEYQKPCRVPQKITTRSAKSRYPDMKKFQKTQGVNKLQEKTEVPEKPEEKNLEDLSKEQENQILPEQSMEIDDEPQVLDCVEALLVYDKESFADGWDIYIKASDNQSLWRNFIYAGAKAVGLIEFSRVYFEQGRLFFPSDFPTTISYQEYSLDLAKTKIAEYFRRPSSKRMNYERIGSPYPFYSDWSFGTEEVSYSDLIPINIKCESRCPKQLAYICAPEPYDLMNTGEIKEPLHDKSQENSKITVKDLEKLRNIGTCRKIIGYVTSGGFSYDRTRGLGIGFIHSSARVFIGKKVLFRNPSSQFYHRCKLYQIQHSKVLFRNPSSQFYHRCKLYQIQHS
ncbi:hypothetical protein SteCoe_8648 [Stentor coeruleus]|uniref:Pop1 N-terminal domain-containing protein n=1 Tax=Stentor coeruleus TaxID=5963 RepID=A0A1R2CJX2_9CILI|nr:hypothetical protein SteCoe_8648 [Stentor coeruleus]